jgi:sugar lactone lactonase YvrE
MVLSPHRGHGKSSFIKNLKPVNLSSTLMRLLFLPAACLSLLLAFATSALPAADLEVVAKLPVGPGNITLTPDNRIIMSLHPFYSPDKRVVELVRGGKLLPFPDANWNSGDLSTDDSFDSVLGIQCDGKGVVWMPDNGIRSGSIPRLVGWDTVKNRLARIIHLGPPAIPPQPVFPDNAFFNDLAVDLKNNAIYISHSAIEDSALIVVDLRTGKARRVLQSHASMVPENTDIVINGKALNFTLPDAGRLKLLIGVNPIALDSSDEWLYYGTMNGNSMYRIRTSVLADAGLTNEQLAQYVERFSEKPICDGISLDNEGNIYISDLESHAIGIIGQDRKYKKLVSDPRISWPESFSFGPDGYLYFVASQLHLSAPLNEGKNKAKPPFYVFRVKALAPGVVGR